MAEHYVSVYGTEKDKVNCPFYVKAGACRHGDRCSRVHNKPVFSQTILLQNLYQSPAQICATAAAHGLPEPQIPDEDRANHFDDFYFDVFDEMSKYGSIDNIYVCENLAEHLSGNTYVKFSDEESAGAALKAVQGRWYAGCQVRSEFSPVTDFREGKCRPFQRDGHCERGNFCHFMHLYKPPQSASLPASPRNQLMDAPATAAKTRYNRHTEHGVNRTVVKKEEDALGLGRERDRDRDRDWDRRHIRERESNLDRDEGREHSRERKRKRDHGRYRDHDQDRNRSHDRSRDRDFGRSRDSDSSRDRDRARDHDREREHDREHRQDRERDRDRPHDRARGRSRERSYHRDRDYSRDYDRDQGRSRTEERERGRAGGIAERDLPREDNGDIPHIGNGKHVENREMKREDEHENRSHGAGDNMMDPVLEKAEDVLESDRPHDIERNNNRDDDGNRYQNRATENHGIAVDDRDARPTYISPRDGDQRLSGYGEDKSSRRELDYRRERSRPRDRSHSERRSSYEHDRRRDYYPRDRGYNRYDDGDRGHRSSRDRRAS